MLRFYYRAKVSSVSCDQAQKIIVFEQVGDDQKKKISDVIFLRRYSYTMIILSCGYKQSVTRRRQTDFCGLKNIYLYFY